jgi:hypothetical protein
MSAQVTVCRKVIQYGRWILGGHQAAVVVHLRGDDRVLAITAATAGTRIAGLVHRSSVPQMLKIFTMCRFGDGSFGKPTPWRVKRVAGQRLRSEG